MGRVFDGYGERLMLDKLRSFQKNTPHRDEHDEPTEPLPQEDVAAFVPTVPNSSVSPNEEDVPSPKTTTHPFPHRFIEEPQTPANVYPVLPARPNLPSSNYPAKPETANNASQRTSARRKILPLAVGMCFVAIQMLLLVRFLLKLLSVSSDSAWVGVVYGVSNVLVLPFRALFLQLAIPQLFTVELYTLLAILVYGIVSRILVHTLKVLMKTR